MIDTNVVGGKKSGIVDKTWLLVKIGVAAVIENFDFDVRFTVVSFLISGAVKDGYTVDAISNSAAFTTPQRLLIRDSNSGDKNYIEYIVAMGPHGVKRVLLGLVFVIK